MATKTVVCPECDAPLSPGRFACSSCGALVASVATVSRSFMPALDVLPPIVTPPGPIEVAPAPAAPTPDLDGPLPPRLAKVLPPVRRAASPPRPEKSVASAGIVVSPPRPPRQQRPRQPAASQQAPLTWVLEDGQPAEKSTPQAGPIAATSAEAVPAAPPTPAPAWTQPLSATSAPSWPAHPTWPPPRPADVVEPVEPPARVVAGAYLPPSAVLPPGDSLPLAGTDQRSEPPEAGGHRPRGRSASPKFRLRLGEEAGPFGMPAEAPTRIVVLGAGLAGLGFLLPWANYVIGHGNVGGGYLDQWGLAGPGHAIILALIAGVAFLALFAAQMPRWVRVGLPSIGLACVLVGLVWPYLVGGLIEASIGVYVVSVGAIIMIGGGLLDRIATRHAESSATV